MKQNILLPVILAVLWFTLITCFYVIVSSRDITIEEGFFAVYYFLKSGGFSGIVFFILLYVLRPLLFIIASPFAILCGFIYGLPSAFIIFFIAEVCSVSFSYVFGKFTGGKFISIGESFTRLKKIELGLREHTFLSMFRLRLIGFPFDLLNYISGILKIPFKPYFFGTMLGVIPYNIAFLTAGAAFYGENIQSFSDISTEVSPFYLVFAGIIFLGTFVFSRVLKKYHKV